jgi:hypothetical protein
MLLLRCKLGLNVKVEGHLEGSGPSRNADNGLDQRTLKGFEAQM